MLLFVCSWWLWCHSSSFYFESTWTVQNSMFLNFQVKLNGVCSFDLAWAWESEATGHIFICSTHNSVPLTLTATSSLKPVSVLSQRLTCRLILSLKFLSLIYFHTTLACTNDVWQSARTVCSIVTYCIFNTGLNVLKRCIIQARAHKWDLS